MKLKSLEINAFLSYKNKTVIDFTKFNDSIFLIDGDTGSGKTTIFDAICYALYGEASDSKRDTNFKSHFADNSEICYVKLTFIELGEEYTIYRQPKQFITSKKKNKDGEYGLTEKESEIYLTLANSKTLTKINEVNRKIIDIIKLDKDQFRNTMMIGQGKFSELIRAKTQDRKALFRSILQTSKFEDFEDYIQGLYTNAKNAIDKENIAINTELKGYKVVDNLELSNKLAIDNPNELDYEELSNLIKSDLENIKVKVEEIESQKTKSLDILNNFKIEENKAKDNNTKVSNYKLHKESLDNILKDKGKYKDYQNTINIYNDSLDTYHEYKTYLDKDKLLKDKTNTLNKTNESIESITNDYFEALENNNKVSSLESDNQNLRNKLKDLNLELENFNLKTTTLNEKSKVETEILNNTNKINDLNLKIKDINEQINSLNKFNIDNKESSVNLEKKKIELKELENNKELLNNYLNDYIELVNKNKLLETTNNKNKELIDNLNLSLKDIESKKVKLNNYNELNKDVSNNILNFTNKMNSLNNDLNDVNEYIKKYKKIESKNIELNNQIVKVTNLSNVYISKEKEYSNINLEYELNLAGILAEGLKENSPCPVCGSIHHIKLASKKNDSINKEKVDEARNQADSAKNKLFEAKAIQTSLENNINQELSELIINVSNKINKDVDRNNLLDIINEYVNALNESISSLTNQIDESKAILDKVNKNQKIIETLNKEYEETFTKISTVKEENIKTNEQIKSNSNKLEEIIKNSANLLNIDINDSNIVSIINQNIESLTIKNTSLLEEINNLNNVIKTINSNDLMIKTLNDNLSKTTNDLNESNKLSSSLSERLKNYNNSIKDLDNKLNGKDLDIINKSINETNESIEKLDKLIDTYRTNFNNLNIEMNKYKTTKNNLEKEILSLTNDCIDLENKYKNSLNNTLIKDIEKLVEFVDSKKQNIPTILKEVEEYNNKLTICNTLYNEDIKNGYDKLTIVSLESIKDKITSYTEILENIEENLKNINNIYSNNLNRFNKYKDIYKSISSKQKALLDLKNLSDVANGKVVGEERIDFETYYQSQIFEHILSQANKKLNIMTDNVYSLVRHESSQDKGQSALDIDVFDTNTAKLRSANSLSGGEMFMASLSLALGFSEISKAKSGACELDNMFIDEGFGTLDEETLRTVMKVLNQLSNESNRTIGVISHVSELRDVIQKQIHVTKDRQNGSKLEFKY